MKRLSSTELFQSEHLSHNLVGKSIHGGISAATSQGVLFAVRISSMMVLARLLTPGDYGVVAMVAGVIGFAALVKDAGLSTVTIQREQVSHEQVSGLFWINFVVSIVLGGIVLACSPLVAMFFKRPELFGVTALMSVSFFVSGLTVQHEALLRRHMHFSAMAVIQIASQIVSQGLTIFLAVQGWHYWALVLGTISGVFVTTLLTLWFCPWVPSMIRRGTGLTEMLRFGRHLVGFNVVGYFSRTADKILVGKFIGADALGIYSTAYMIFSMPFTRIRVPMAQIALPVLSSLQSQPERYVKYYQKLLDITVSIILPVLLYCGLEADFLVEIVLGPQWIDAVPVFRILVFAGILQSVSGNVSVVQLSRGYSKRYLYWGVINASVIFLALLIGLRFGIKGVAISYVVANLIVFLPKLTYCLQDSPVTVGLVLKSVRVPFLLSAIAWAGAFLIKTALPMKTFLDHLLVLIVFWGVIIVSLFIRQSVLEIYRLVLSGGILKSLGTESDMH